MSAFLMTNTGLSLMETHLDTAERMWEDFK